MQNKVQAVIKGSITNLSRFKNNTFDAVICLGGPLSHIEGASSRNKAVSELIRVAKKNAVILVSVMGRFGGLAMAPGYWPHEITTAKDFRRFWKTGDDYRWRKIYYSHYFTPEELKKIFTRKNCRILEFVGLEGLGTPSPEAINKLARNKKAWKNWLESHYNLCTHPVVAGASVHMMIVCRR